MKLAYSVVCMAAVAAAWGLPSAAPAAEDHPKVFPDPIFITGTPEAALVSDPKGSGVFLSPTGASLFFCSVNGCFPGPHLAAQGLVNMESRLDATSQEVGFFVNATSRTGAVLQWKPRTPVSKGAEVQFPDGALFQATKSGMTDATASGEGSPGWRRLGDTIHNGKTALGAGLNMVPGSGQGWSLVSDLTVQPGVGDQNAFGYENDCANYNKDSDFGVPFLMTCFFQGGQGRGTKPMFSYRYVAAGDGSSFGAHFGDFFNGSNTIKDATIADATNALNTVRVNSGTRHDSVFLDASASNRSIDLRGTYKIAIDLSNARTGAAQISGRGWRVEPDGTISAAGLITTGTPPKTSSDDCKRGEVRFAENFIYVCVEVGKWKRAALSSW